MKESFYFPHDYEASNDPKVQALLSEYGGIGYGVFWRIIELLHSDQEHKIPMKQYIFMAIAKQMLASAEQIMAIVNFAINECELFETDGDFIWSNRVNRNFLRRKEISNKRSISGKLGAEKKWSMANAKQNLAKHGKEKEIKEKEIKEKKNTYSADFLSFWNAYPKKSGSKKAAFDNWQKLNGGKPDIETILAAIKDQIEWRENARDGDFRPEWKDPERWIKGKMWEAELSIPNTGNGRKEAWEI